MRRLEFDACEASRLPSIRGTASRQPRARRSGGRDLTGAFALVTGGHAGIGLRDHPRAGRGRCDGTVGARALDTGARGAGRARARRGRAARSPRSRLDRRVCRALYGLGPAAAHAREQRRDHGASAGARRARVRVAARHQPHRPLPADGAPLAGPAGSQGRPGGVALLARAPPRRHRLRRSAVRPPPLRQVDRLRPVEDRQRSFRPGPGRARRAPSRARLRGPPRRRHD